MHVLEVVEPRDDTTARREMVEQATRGAVRRVDGAQEAEGLREQAARRCGLQSEERQNSFWELGMAQIIYVCMDWKSVYFQEIRQTSHGMFSVSQPIFPISLPSEKGSIRGNNRSF